MRIPSGCYSREGSPQCHSTLSKTASASKLARGSTKVLTAEENVRPISHPFVPCLEFPRSGEKPLLPHEPAYLKQHGLLNKISYIADTTKKEGAT
ncbi:hypothetical protein PR048_018154 [Dryococelus australis]|uniref:Uncharacterized protein n=1 Tax=Dryococelus australis TaxID=614101 RepID=A0ABQ9HBH2_9NEOP|nr:hypothetical protein PR048_018154 [Dryococelus australis]